MYLVQIAEEKEFDKEEIILEEGMTSDGLYIIVEGEISQGIFTALSRRIRSLVEQLDDGTRERNKYP